MEFLLGRDYPHLCDTCRAAIDTAALLLGEEGPDTDNIEAPIDFVYDHSLYCGGRSCQPSHIGDWYFIRLDGEDVEGYGNLRKAIERVEHMREHPNLWNLSLRLVDDRTGEMLYTVRNDGKGTLTEYGSLDELRERLGLSKERVQ